MEITVAGQTWIFLLSIVLGAALGICYDVLRILRVAFAHAIAVVFAEDILFSVVCATATVLFTLGVDRGRIRAFVLIGEAMGFILYYCTVGVLVLGVSKSVIAGIKWLWGWIFRLLFAPILRIVKYFYCFLVKIMKFLAFYLKIKTKNSKCYLKKHSQLLYNLRKRLRTGRTGKQGRAGRQI